MTIYVDKNLFHLQTQNSCYLFQIMANGELGQLYYGRGIHHKSAYHNLAQREQHDAMASWTLDQPDFQSEILKQEYASLVREILAIPPIKCKRLMAVELAS